MLSTRQLLLAASVTLSSLAAQEKGAPAAPALPPLREVTISGIPGVLDGAAKWKLIWQGNENADGIAASSDGGLLFAQEQLSQISKLDKNDKYSAFLKNGHGPGAVAIGPKGRIIVVERTCTDPGRHMAPNAPACTEPAGIAALTPERKVLADNIAGKSLGRVNDLVADKKGGVYFTSGGAFYINPAGQISTVGENLRTNGIMLSGDEKTLYITNGPTVAAFDVQPDGSVKNQREFAKLPGGGDGMATDAAGRLFVTVPSAGGIEVLSTDGKPLGLIPVPRSPISVAFSGPGKKTLYVAGLGALGPDGKEVTVPQGVRLTAMTLYKIPTLTQGFKGRPK